MFNRANKMTALLVAAAAVVSLVPATGVNAADVKRVDTKDGTLYHAVAFKDGNFYVDGEVNDKDEAAYYLADGKYNELDKIDSNSEVTIYGEKYVNVEDGDYFIDLTNGKVTDDDVKDDSEDDAASALRKKVKNDTDGRYIEGNNSNESETIFNLEDLALPGAKFGEIWYGVQYKTEDATNNLEKGGLLNVYADSKGNYIDADYNIGKIKVKPTTGSAVTVDNTSDEFDFGKDKKKNLKAGVSDSRVLTQDSKNIYRIATITLEVKDGAKISEVYGIDVNKDNAFTVDGDKVTFNAIQKISKDQASDDIDGAKYAKSVTTYVISKDNGEELKSGELLADATHTSKELYTVANGKLVAYAKDASKDEVKTQTITLKSKSGLYYTDVADEASESVEKNADNKEYEDGIAIDIDSDGNLWRLDGGYVYKWDNDEDWDKVYRVDGSMDRLSVYNKDNMVTWNEDDEVYSVIGEKEEKEEKPEVEVKAGWKQAADGTWTYFKEDKTKATGWFQDGANWYLADEAGIMQTGWKTVNGTWYYLDGSGAMKTGWIIDNGTWYYADGSGAMQTGWINDNGTWYFCDGSGKMLANTTVNGYVLGANGAWVK
ncbi:N-acetylmuramoyl-L-alanine amidase family protein [Clostridium botulinum]|nr:N-acetylmuramoyl-L-alanine amidase family protein [Clostridium botulinum]NFS95142.1 N-acetylmuramoyl-L-alanine amidase family protein [Clostridium botulinum]